MIATSRNILLRQLARRDQALLEPHVEEVTFEAGTAFIAANALLSAVYFPDSVVVSIEEPMEEEPAIEVGLVGREGLLGWPALLGCDQSPHRAIVQMRSGRLLRVPVEAMGAACRASPGLRGALLRFVQIVTVQMARAIVSHLRDPLERRLSRWLLMRHDRVGGDAILIHHDQVSANLSVRRASVTDALHILEGERLVRCHRGRILIRDRAGLETRAGTSYGVPEAQYRLLIAPFGKSGQPLATELRPVWAQ